MFYIYISNTWNVGRETQVLKCTCFTRERYTHFTCFTSTGRARRACFTAALLLLYCCFTAALLLLYCCFTAALLLLHRCFFCALLTLSCCFTAALLLLYYCLEHIQTLRILAAKHRAERDWQDQVSSARLKARALERGTPFTCSTSTKVQILTQNRG